MSPTKSCSDTDLKYWHYLPGKKQRARNLTSLTSTHYELKCDYLLKGNISPSVEHLCFQVNEHLRKQVCNLLQEADVDRLDLHLDLSFSWEITQRTHKASTLWQVSVKSHKILNCFLKDDFSPTLPHISQGNKSRSPKSSQTETQRLHSFESTVSEGNFWLWSPLPLSLYFSPEHSRPYWWTLRRLSIIKSVNS